MRDEHGDQVEAVSIVAAVPSLPGVAHRSTLHQTGDGEGDASKEVEGLGAPQNYGEVRVDQVEDALVEKEDGGLESGDVDDVDYFEGEEYLGRC